MGSQASFWGGVVTKKREGVHQGSMGDSLGGTQLTRGAILSLCRAEHVHRPRLQVVNITTLPGNVLRGSYLVLMHLEGSRLMADARAPMDDMAQNPQTGKTYRRRSEQCSSPASPV